ncbi:hypothetical protein CWC18_06085 [Pseudoalteromonas aurantia]|uniref:Uncharacterized protein n=1 Tax=Pseudoalteromonas aurantia TaxID=43654 RepID=A0ABY2VWD0_9GAMM|nr:hypothetical protein CWC18_06085 [Pseudoalteromonas aurantia]TMO73652.1 hypothetical protein CWC20_12670 [Pseudoalteromonas aurantia]
MRLYQAALSGHKHTHYKTTHSNSAQKCITYCACHSFENPSSANLSSSNQYSVNSHSEHQP